MIGGARMPDKTADALARILSLSSAQRHEERSHSLADGPDGPVAAPGPTEAKSEYSVAGREFSPGLMGSLFYDVFPDQGEEPLADARPRFGSKVSNQIPRACVGGAFCRTLAISCAQEFRLLAPAVLPQLCAALPVLL